MIRFRPLLLMTIFTIAVLCILIPLGRWQWERYVQKTAAANEPLAQMTIASYQPVPDGIQFVFGLRPDTRQEGWRVFAPVTYGDSTVFVDADFIAQVAPPNPSEVRFPAALRFGAPVTGASIRPPPLNTVSRALFHPDPLRRLWPAIDLNAMGRNGGLSNVADYYIAAAYVGADGRATHNPFAVAAGSDSLPPARHLGYAMTWYGLALVLIIVYFSYHRSVGRLSFGPPRRREE